MVPPRRGKVTAFVIVFVTVSVGAVMFATRLKMVTVWEVELRLATWEEGRRPRMKRSWLLSVS